MNFIDSFLIAFRTVRSNKLRTGITVAIIAFGIMALIGIITAIEAMNQSLKESFSSMGANAFNIRFKESNMRMGHSNNLTKSKKGKRVRQSTLNKVIRKEDAEYFKENYKFPAQVSIYLRGGGGIDCTFGDKKTNPVTNIWGGDENYLQVNGFNILDGRNLNSLDVESGRNVCLIGYNTATKLFGAENPEKCIEQIIHVAGLPYRVIGLLKKKGTSGMLRQDDIVVTSYNNARRFKNASSSYLIGVMVGNVAELETAMDEATSVFRGVRKLEPTDAENFVLEKSDKAAEMVMSFLGAISGSAGAIGLITLISAAIALMNIMLVSVNERTREVGLVKAIGGKSKNVRQQFLFESMIISLMGALFGIVLGILIGNLFASFMHTGFIVPWAWVIIGILICSLVGLVAGLYPAIKASRLNPIVALRYE
jgi:putative ABC transport system permease protein